MKKSINFDSKEACGLLAKLIDTAPSLKKINIGYQIGKRTVKVLVQYAKEVDGVIKKGYIKIFSDIKESLVYVVKHTNKTSANKV